MGYRAILLIVILVFGMLFSFLFVSEIVPERSRITIVIIPQDSALESSGRNFDPQVITVVNGMNNTVRWHNQDLTLYTVVASSNDDPLFYNATRIQCENNDYQDCVVIPGKNQLPPDGTFEFTFTKPGVFDYHSVPHPHMKGTVIVLAPEK